MRKTMLIAFSIVLGVLAAACHTSTGATPALPCAGHACLISVQNDGATFLSLRYVDSVGHSTVLGLVNPAAVRFFRVQWVKSGTIRVVADIRNGGTYFSNLVLQSMRTNELHFPDDFQAADDGVATARPGVSGR